MSNLYTRNIIRFITLLLFQVLVLNNMNLGGYIIQSEIAKGSVDIWLADLSVGA